MDVGFNLVHPGHLRRRTREEHSQRSPIGWLLGRRRRRQQPLELCCLCRCFVVVAATAAAAAAAASGFAFLSLALLPLLPLLLLVGRRRRRSRLQPTDRRLAKWGKVSSYFRLNCAPPSPSPGLPATDVCASVGASLNCARSRQSVCLCVRHLMATESAAAEITQRATYFYALHTHSQPASQPVNANNTQSRCSHFPSPVSIAAATHYCELQQRTTSPLNVR